MKRYEFKITLAGYGSTPEEAWNGALEAFGTGLEDIPEEYTVEETDEDD